MVHQLSPLEDFRRWLWNSPTEHHDRPKLEMSGAWEPSSSLVPLPVGEG
jgi:hypothetical protein